MRHSHRWVDESAHYTPPPPRSSNPKVEGVTDLVLSVVYGITVVTQRCESCGEVAHRRTPGNSIDGPSVLVN